MTSSHGRSSTASAPREPGRVGRGPRVPWLVLIGGLLIAYLPKYAPGALAGAGFETGWGPLGGQLWNWLAVGLLALYVWRVEGLGASSLRLVRPTEQDLNWAGWLGGAALLWSWLSSTFLLGGSDALGDSGDGSGEAMILALGPLLILVLVISVSISEEVLWRGYVVERLGARIGPVIAAVIGLAVFSLGHVEFFGADWLVTNLPGAALLYVLLLWRRNLWACILFHVISDIPLFFVALFW